MPDVRREDQKIKTILKVVLLGICLFVTIWVGFFTGWSLDDMQVAFVTVPVILAIVASFWSPVLDLLIGVFACILALGFAFYGGLLVFMSLVVGHMALEVVALCVALFLGCVTSSMLAMTLFRKKRATMRSSELPPVGAAGSRSP